MIHFLKTDRFWLILASSVLVVLFSLSIYNNQSIMVGNKRAFFLQDDVMISMRYARNLANGDGLVWNPGGERVEGYTNFGWVMIMVLVHLLPLPITQTSLVILLINISLSVVVLWLSRRLMLVLAPNQIPALAALLVCLILLSDLGRWATIGLESTLLTALFLWLTLRVLKEAEADKPSMITYALTGGLGILRADGLIYSISLCVLAYLLSQERQRLALLFPWVLGLPLLHMIFRVSYYGSLLPNTYYLKVTGWELSQRMLAGLRYEINFLRTYGIGIAVAGYGVWISRDRRASALFWMGLPLFIYVLYVGGDDFSGGRMFAPWIPVLLILMFLTPYWLGWKTKPIRYFVSLSLISAMTVILTGYHFFQGPGYEVKFLKAGLVLRRMTLAETRIATLWAGTLPYFADRPGVDLLGKNDATIARLPTHPGSLKPGHNKYDFGYSLGVLRPDLVVQAAHPSMITGAQKLEEISQGDDSYLGQLYLDDVFQKQYAANLVVIDQVPIYIRFDSEELGRLMAGVCNPVDDNQLSELGLNTICTLSEDYSNP